MELTYGPVAGLPKMVNVQCAKQVATISEFRAYESYIVHRGMPIGVPIGVEFSEVIEEAINPWDAVDAAACRLRQIITEQSEGMDAPAAIWRRVPQVQRRDDPRTGGTTWVAGARVVVIDLARLPRESDELAAMEQVDA